MKFKAKKSSRLLLREERVDRRVKIQGVEVPSIVGNPIKCLGEEFNISLTDEESIEDTKKLLAWLKQLMAVDYLESTRHGSTSKGSYQDLCGCSLYV